MIFREWGMLLRDSGQADATDRAIECFEEALKDAPNDSVAIHALATMLQRKGQYRRVIELLEPLQANPSKKTREMVSNALRVAYERTGEMAKLAELKIRMEGN